MILRDDLMDWLKKMPLNSEVIVEFNYNRKRWITPIKEVRLNDPPTVDYLTLDIKGIPQIFKEIFDE